MRKMKIRGAWTEELWGSPRSRECGTHYTPIWVRRSLILPRQAARNDAIEGPGTLIPSDRTLFCLSCVRHEGICHRVAFLSLRPLSGLRGEVFS
ncbi:hypothetical protein CEXT_36071 [Caerostris extrusa]|uniref:Uncharacterized protein n=1 Tax=Caerostris extrusa TaxID=172846 RepID=A0AAV4ME32_CAEEX|nr:hypothetical protein CEXT_36071 [Caerostris extrusa]